MKLAQSLHSHSTEKGQAWDISLHHQQEMDGEGDMSIVLGPMGFSYTEFGEERCKLFRENLQYLQISKWEKVKHRSLTVRKECGLTLDSLWAIVWKLTHQ